MLADGLSAEEAEALRGAAEDNLSYVASNQILAAISRESCGHDDVHHERTICVPCLYCMCTICVLYVYYTCIICVLYVY